MAAVTSKPLVKTIPRVECKPLRLPQHERRTSPLLVVGGALTALMVLVAFAAPYLTPYDPAAMTPIAKLQAPSMQHVFGTDIYGRDLFSRVVYGARLSLGVTIASVALGAVPGTLLGILFGMRRGLAESIFTQVMDAWLALPPLLLALVMAATFGRSLLTLTLALGLAGIPSYYRMTRAETLRLRGELFVHASESLGAGRWHLLVHHLLPNALPYLLVLVGLRLGRMLLAVSALSFIGLGTPPPSPEWGALLAEGRDYMHLAWWLTVFPGLSIALTVFGFNLLSDGLRDWLDPHHHD
jgi:peptide/nickel transport system permease protein